MHAMHRNAHMLKTCNQLHSDDWLQYEARPEGPCDIKVVSWVRSGCFEMVSPCLTFDYSWDLGGQPRFRPMWERYCRGVNAIV